MITKKTFVTTSSLFFSAILLSQIYSFSNAKSHSQEINLEAFSNLSENIKSISTNTDKISSTRNEETVVTNDIIKVIDNELTQKIKKTRYSLHSIKAKMAKAKMMAAVAHAPQIAPAIERALDKDDLSAYEINNKDFINLYAIEADFKEYSKFASIALSPSYNEEMKDEVVVAQASTEVAPSAPIEADEVKTIQPATTRNEIAEDIKESKDDDMVMFDYSAKKAEQPVAKTIDQKLYERPLSETVKNAISREIGSAPIKRLEPVNTQRIAPAEKTKIDDQEIDLNSEENTVYDYTKENGQKAVNTQKSEEDAFLAPQLTSTHETQFVLRAKEINMNTHKVRQANAFEFVPDYDRAERMNDQASGEISFGYSLSGEMNTQTGVVQAQGMIPTRVELSLVASKGLEVPLINEEGIQKFLQKQGLSIEGNLLMIAIDPSITDAEIDSQFGQKFFFDQNFKALSSMSGASYVLFAGVKSGNVLIRYLLNNKESAQKIVYVGDGEMYFEDPSFINSTRETFTFTTRNLLGQKKKELILDGNDISYFNTNITAKKKTLNAYEIKVPTLVSGMRKYLEFKHLDDSVFVGSWNERDIEIPGNEFIGKVLEMNHVSSLKDRCVVQVNLSKDLREMKANGKNRSGEMFVETSYLDKDGNFSRDSAEMAEKAFIVGDMEGQFNVKLDYTDGSTEFLKTFCSEGSYLIEQL
ncbi:MAG: hypothetical protein ACXVLQ_17155 [Bacteriovorax sp.]